MMFHNDPSSYQQILAFTALKIHTLKLGMSIKASFISTPCIIKFTEHSTTVKSGQVCVFKSGSELSLQCQMW